MSLNQMMTSVIDGHQTHAASMIVPAHVAQMVTFGIRQGLSFYPAQDNPQQSRQKFLDALIKDNKLELYQERIWELFVCTGELLWYLRPTEESYQILFFRNNQFKAFYDANGSLIKVVIIYDYEVDDPSSTDRNAIQNYKTVRIVLTKETIRIAESDGKNAFTFTSLNPHFNEQYIENYLGFIPCVVSKNRDLGPGQKGRDDFTWLKAPIEQHDAMASNIIDNLATFGNPTLVTSRSLQDIVDLTDGTAANARGRTVAAASGFGAGGTNLRQPAPSYSDYVSRLRTSGGMRVKKLVCNVQQGDQFAYLTPDAVSGDQNRYQAQYQELLRSILGGQDELSISSGATAFEIKSIYGRVASTANRKAKALYTYGLCELLSMAVLAEEMNYRRSLFVLLNPDPSNPQIPMDLLTTENIHQLIAANQIPPGVIGLPPLGDREVLWDYTGPVYEDAPRDKLSLSIIGRNLREDGFDTLYVLKQIFPDKSDKELKTMLGGFPVRIANQIIGGIQQLLGLYQYLLQIPDPQNPGIPYGLRMAPAIEQLVQKGVESLYKEMSYGPTIDPQNPALAPPLNPLAQLLADAKKLRNPNYSTEVINEPAVSAPGQPTSPIPTPAPGATVGGPTAGNPSFTGGVRTAQPITSGSVLSPSQSSPIPSDLLSDPKLFEQLFPGFSSLLDRSGSGSGNGQRRNDRQGTKDRTSRRRNNGGT